MTEISHLINAIMLLPVGASVDSQRAQLCHLHSERRGYRLIGIVHDWASALAKMRAEQVQVCVVADPEDMGPDWTPRLEYVGEDTKDLLRHGHIQHRNDPPSDPGDGRRRRPRPAH